MGPPLVEVILAAFKKPLVYDLDGMIYRSFDHGDSFFSGT